MPLVVAVHTVQAVTATVPLSMIMLTDFFKHKNLPEQLKLRMLLPTSGAQSVTLWDVPSVDALQIWLNENLNMDCQSEVFQVQEDFMLGFGFELARLRAAEKVTQSAKATLHKINNTSIKAELSNIQEPFARATSKENVAAAIDNFQAGVSTGIKRTQAAWSWVSGKVMEKMTAPSPYVPPPSYRETSTSSLDGMFVPPAPPTHITPSVDNTPATTAQQPSAVTGQQSMQPAVSTVPVSAPVLAPVTSNPYTVDDDDELLDEPISQTHSTPSLPTQLSETTLPQSTPQHTKDGKEVKNDVSEKDGKE